MRIILLLALVGVVQARIYISAVAEHDPVKPKAGESANDVKNRNLDLYQAHVKSRFCNEGKSVDLP